MYICCPLKITQHIAINSKPLATKVSTPLGENVLIGPIWCDRSHSLILVTGSLTWQRTGGGISNTSPSHTKLIPFVLKSVFLSVLIFTDSSFICCQRLHTSPFSHLSFFQFSSLCFFMSLLYNKMFVFPLRAGFSLCWTQQTHLVSTNEALMDMSSYRWFCIL